MVPMTGRSTKRSAARSTAPRPSDENTLHANTAEAWRTWLAEKGQSATQIWLVIQHKDSGIPSLSYHEAIEHALCYGWIDSLARKRDATSSCLRFTPRNPRSSWSHVNRQRAGRMIDLGLMTESGQALIDRAKSAGTWQVLPDDEASAVPADLRDLLDQDEAARTNLGQFPPTSKRLILEWVAKAKAPGTRVRRIEQTVILAAVNIRANHPRPVSR
jgi:uncharacterized protein YdeI (YjbR/CyaY-like superfamily)